MTEENAGTPGPFARSGPERDDFALGIVATAIEQDAPGDVGRGTAHEIAASIVHDLWMAGYVVEFKGPNPLGFSEDTP